MQLRAAPSHGERGAAARLDLSLPGLPAKNRQRVRCAGALPARRRQGQRRVSGVRSRRRRRKQDHIPFLSPMRCHPALRRLGSRGTHRRSGRRIRRPGLSGAVILGVRGPARTAGSGCLRPSNTWRNTEAPTISGKRQAAARPGCVPIVAPSPIKSKRLPVRAVLEPDPRAHFERGGDRPVAIRCEGPGATDAWQRRGLSAASSARSG